MSFVYAEKIKNTIEDEQIQGIKIYSDTKVSIEGAVKTNWSEQQRKAIEKYGMCKSIIIDPKCCISFAGNNIYRISFQSRLFINQLNGRLYDYLVFRTIKKA